MIGLKRDVSALLLVAELETAELEIAELDCVTFVLEEVVVAELDGFDSELVAAELNEVELVEIEAELDAPFAELTGTVAALETIFTELDDAVELERNFDELDSFDFGLEENTSEL